MFRRLLIANRGEIALRIVRACESLDVESVVACSEADREAPWVRRATRSVCVGPARADRSYLDTDAILQAAEQEECQAVHPGYGFLAENAAFAARCEQQGLAFVGPTASAIRRMGDKASAKRTMEQAGLPTIPGSSGALDDSAQAAELAERIGYPVLLKASAGGGGRGMRRCGNASEVESAFAEAALEAGKAFGDSRLYLEKWIEGGRHIEFQVLCDAYGNGIHLGERDCSIQRKHQKLVEESPSPALDPGARDSLGEQVARAVAELGYRNAGTVEFLRDDEGRFYFMEMNARLQVEHPVTEAVTGIDLVQEQLRIAANRPLRHAQSDIRVQGHAIEFRINAENPEDGFRPDPGTIEEFRPPTVKVRGVSVRWDSAVEAGYRIPPHYDSLIGKLIVHGPSRPSALKGARQALQTLTLRGVHTTIPLHLGLLGEAGFREGSYDIGFLAQRVPIGLE